MGFSVKDPIRGSITGNAGTVNNHTVEKDVPADAKFTDTTYESKAAASGGTAVSLVTTGEKYIWNNKGSGTITGVSVNGTSIATSGTANITSIPASILTGAIPSAVTATTQTQGDNSTKIATTAYVDKAVDDLPEPMVFKGSLGTGGTITALPVDGSATIGDTYKVITAGTYASKAAKVGDTFICLTKTSSANTWELIPSGDEPSGTVTSITLKATSPIAIDSETAITDSGTRTLSHANSGVTAGTYRSITVNATGHVTAGTNPTTLSGYGITDAKINDKTITLGSNSIIVPTKTSELTNDNNFITAANDITGNAATATKLKNAKTISTTGDVVSSGTFDGSDNLVLSTRRRGASVGQSSNTTTNPWYKVASATISAGYNDRWITFLVNGAYATFKTRMGILKAQFRVNGSGLWEDGGLWWESVTNDINLDDFVLAYKNNESSVTVEIWCNVAASYNGYHFEVLGEGSRDGRSNRDWTLYTTWSAGSQSSLPDGYTTIVSIASTLKNTATKATQDGGGNIITSTYVKKSGDTMTGALNLANGTSNKIGDDVSIGDFNKAGALGIMGQNGATTLALIKNGSSWGASAERAEMVYNSTDKCIEFNFV